MIAEAELKGLIITKTNPNLFPPNRFKEDKKRSIKFTESGSFGRVRRSPYSGTIIHQFERLKFIYQYIKSYVDIDGLGYFICLICSPTPMRDSGVNSFNHIEKHIAVMKSAYRNEKKFKEAMEEMLWG
jgi:hypothetical protein